MRPTPLELSTIFINKKIHKILIDNHLDRRACVYIDSRKCSLKIYLYAGKSAGGVLLADNQRETKGRIII
jgi:hypothetical protein